MFSIKKAGNVFIEFEYIFPIEMQTRNERYFAKKEQAIREADFERGNSFELWNLNSIIKFRCEKDGRPILIINLYKEASYSNEFIPKSRTVSGAHGFRINFSSNPKRGTIKARLPNKKIRDKIYEEIFPEIIKIERFFGTPVQFELGF